MICDSSPVATVTGKAGLRLGSLVLLSRASGGRWWCKCDCGRVEKYRWIALRSEGTSSIRLCTTCDVQPCRTCGTDIPRGKRRYCSETCRKQALGVRQAIYYQSRMQVPAYRKKQQEQRRARRRNITQEQREHQRAVKRSWIAGLTPDQLEAIRQQRRLWYDVNADRVSARRRVARLSLTPEQRASAGIYMRSWYREKLERLQQDPQAFKAYRIHRQALCRERRASIMREAMAADLSRLEAMLDQ